MSIPRGLDMQDRPGAGPRQQLPSLSSIFGPPPPVRPLISPPIDRSDAYTLDRQREQGVQPHPAYPGGAAQVSHHTKPYERNYDHDRHQLPTFPRAMEAREPARYPGAMPLIRDARPEPQQDPRWYQESSKEYSQGPREPFFRSAHDRDRYPFYAAKEARQGYPEPPAGHSAPSQPPTMPTVPVAAEAVHTKDGLGPKIWTGTHFLPRFVKAEEVPGEGLCYFYDDGSHCKTVIDGETVNAHWGVTKAGKPRKRLAIACVTCREKKIKCDPDYPRCVQCEKFGRVCKFKNA
jgi:hypothetical protein